MATITTTIARFVALPIIAAGIAGGAALGFAGAASAATTPGAAPSISTTDGNFHAPTTYSRPMTIAPGARAHREYHRSH